jgi:cystathionine beta-lyase family protein involved in aluminum resistance
MAFSKQVTLENNFGEISKFPNAYIKVDKVEATKATCIAYVSTLKNKDEQILVTNLYPFVSDLSGENHLKQAYLYLKTLPEFSDATDC